MSASLKKNDVTQKSSSGTDAPADVEEHCDHGG